MLAAVRQVGEDARKLAQMLVTHEGRCLAVNHRTFDGKAMVGGDNLANYDAAMAGRCRTLSAALHELVNVVTQYAAKSQANASR